MSNDTAMAEIRATIERIKQYEADTDHMREILAQHVTELHSAISLPEGKEVDTLLQFVIRYIDHVPDFIDALTAIARAANFYHAIEPLITLATDYFLKPPDIVADHTGLDALVDEAYLAHRLIEEVNDRCMLASGIPLAPMDMTVSNLIIHTLIGEDFANQLDDAVHLSVELLLSDIQLFDTQEFQQYANEHKSRGWNQELSEWPCFTDDIAINVAF